MLSVQGQLPQGPLATQKLGTASWPTDSSSGTLPSGWGYSYRSLCTPPSSARRNPPGSGFRVSCQSLHALFLAPKCILLVTRPNVPDEAAPQLLVTPVRRKTPEGRNLSFSEERSCSQATHTAPSHGEVQASSRPPKSAGCPRHHRCLPQGTQKWQLQSLRLNLPS